MKKKNFTFIFFALLCLSASAQKYKSSCDYLKTLLKDDRIKDSIHLKFNNDSLTFIDMENTLGNNCAPVYWGNNRVSIRYDKKEVEKLNYMDPYYPLKDSCHVFLCSFKRKGRNATLYLHQPCHNLWVELEARYGRKLHIRKIKNGVY